MAAFFAICHKSMAQNNTSPTLASIKGVVFNENNGERVGGALIYSTIEKFYVYANEDGLFSLMNVSEGDHKLLFIFPGFDTLVENVTVKPSQAVYLKVYLKPKVEGITNVSISKKKKPKNVELATEISGQDILKLPSVGGEPDILQYLQILPGVVFSGDQGGQLYIRGGSPIMNKVTLDGLTIYNPFHSIGLFSVFETDLIKSADIYTAGFGSEYGGRIGAVIDIKSRDGDLERFRGKLAMNSITSKVLLEGPLKKFQKGKTNAAYTLSYRSSYLRQSSQLLYQYANPDNLPYNFNDINAKITINSPNGGYLKFYGFRNSDNVRFKNSTSYSWVSNGYGGKFLVIPEAAKTRVDGFFLYSDYEISQEESKEILLGLKNDRSSRIGGFNLGLNFNYNLRSDEMRWGLELNGFGTKFTLFNPNSRFIRQEDYTSEISAYYNYRFIRRKWLANVGIRNQYYASLGNNSLEPRINLQYMPFPWLVFKTAYGHYSQNLLSATSDRDVVNLFYGFLSGPENLPKTFNGKPVTHSLQKSRHTLAGFEFNITRNQTLSINAFYKWFDQVTNINRDKLFDNKPLYQDKPERLRSDFIVENGNAYGGDIWYKYSKKPFYIWLVYSLTWVNRFDGIINYQPVFDRRHNINALISYETPGERPFELSLRWNLGSGFPFTQTQGFYEKFDFTQGLNTDYTQVNGNLGILYAPLNQGRLPYYHRLDFSAKKQWNLGSKRYPKILSVTGTITNVYNRANVFYFERVSQTRVNQLPFLPALGVSYSF